MLQRDFFRTADAAQAAVTNAIANLTTTLTNAATSAGAQVPVAAPSIKTRILKIESMPAGSMPATAIPYSKVTWQATTFDTQIVVVESVMPTAQIDPALGGSMTLAAGASTMSSGSQTLPVGTFNVGSTTGFSTAGSFVVGGQRVTYTGTTPTSFTGCVGGVGTIATGQTVAQGYATATVRLRVAKSLYVRRPASGLLVPDLATFQDPITGKTYQIPSGSGSTTTVIFGVNEVNALDLGEVTLGTSLVPVPSTWGSTSSAGMSAQVIAMQPATITSGTILTDPLTGLSYTVFGTHLIQDANGGLTGFVVGEVPIVGGVPGPASIASLESLAWSTQPAGASKIVVTTANALVTVPHGTEMTNSSVAPAVQYHTLADVQIGDAMSATNVPFVPDAGIVSVKCAVGSTNTLISPPAGVSPTASVTAVTTAQLIPGDYAPEVIGDAPSLLSFVQLELDGRWSATIYTDPFGS